MEILCVLLMTLSSLSQQPDCWYITASDLADVKAPTFDTYRVIQETVENPKLDLASNPVARKYRTVLRLEIAKGPNYAGHYRLVYWGCGTSCANFAVVNLKTGRVITPEGLSEVVGVRFYADEFLPNTDSDGWGFRHKRNSSLLVITGSLLSDSGSREGAFYFVLNGERLHLIHSTVVTKNCKSKQ